MKHCIGIISLLLLFISTTEARAEESAKIGSGDKRSMNYYPVDGDFVTVNGKNRYTRALYGTQTLFRLETSDAPIFAIYNKKNNCNISFTLIRQDGKVIPLEEVTYCKSMYGKGNRRYIIRDSRIGAAQINLCAVTLSDMNGALWIIDNKNLGKAKLVCTVTDVRNTRLSRNGDMGVDLINSFDRSLNPKYLLSDTLELNNRRSAISVVTADNGYRIVKYKGDISKGKRLDDKFINETLNIKEKLSQSLSISTPDKFLNPIGSALSLAADAIWDGKVWLHGAVGWRMPLNGWRAAYTGDFIGWHDRARTHFNAYALSQVDTIAPTISHPSQDKSLNMARAEKRWGTQMYSNGYICRNPENKRQMHHYDMNLCYIDELLWHLNWTGDIEYAKKMWPTIKRHLEWEKRNFDPDDDALYDAYCCIWASDALYYNSGAVTHSSAYNYRANRDAARIARLIGEDPKPYETESKRILNAMNENLWLDKTGCWAEYKDFMGYGRVHESAALWTIYHAIDSEACTPQQAYSATCYIDKNIPHIPVECDSISEKLYTVSTSNWMPYSWSINNVAFEEVYHTTLAYWKAGRYDEAYSLLKACIMDGMYLGKSPGNIGQTSYYDAARGECYRDFGDTVGILMRAIVQGLYGIEPDLLEDKVLIKPGFPSLWNSASIDISDISYSFKREGSKDFYDIKPSFKKKADIVLKVKKISSDISSIKINGGKASYDIEKGVECDWVKIMIPANLKKMNVEITWSGKSCLKNHYVDSKKSFDVMPADQMTTDEMYTGEMHKDEMPANEKYNLPGFAHVDAANCQPVDISNILNDNLSQIFRNNYISPRSPYTTLQIPVHGIGEWCHPLDSAHIDDSGLRRKSDGNIFVANNVPFRSMQKGKNIAFTSLWDNYPDSLSIPIEGNASNIYLLMAGTTNHMQSRIDNGMLKVCYEDGSEQCMPLTNPYNWAPIEQDYFVDNKAFQLSTKRPYRVHLKSGIVSDNLQDELKIDGVYGRRIDGGGGILIDFPIDKSKILKSLNVITLSNDVIIGVIGVTLQR